MLYPDLSQIGLGTALVDGRPAVRLCTGHPYAVGYRVGAADVPLDGPVVVLGTRPGENEIKLAVRTRYGALRNHVLRYRVNGA